MHGNIGLHEMYALVSPQDFAVAMERHWTGTLGLCSSEPLKALWTVVAKTFQASIIGTLNNEPQPWRILQPPTGSGKTEGSCVYAAMQAKLNVAEAERRRPVGILMVTRLIEQANQVAQTINMMVGRTVAVTHHSEHRASEKELSDSDVLVITHQAYVNASDDAAQGDQRIMARLTEWKGGQRCLTIVDEALANVIEHNKVTHERLQQVLACISIEMREEFRDEVAALEMLKDTILSLSRDKAPMSVVWEEFRPGPVCSMSALRAAMKSLPYDRMLLKEENANTRSRLSSQTDKVLEDAERILRRWAYYATKGREYSLNSAAMLIPLDVPGPVVLDATASANVLWELMEKRAEIVRVPRNTRDYGNVTLHVAYASGLGKHKMIAMKQSRFPQLAAALDRQFGEGRSVFLCTNKDVEHMALRYQPKVARFSVGHWGAVDGRNDWCEYDTAVIFGLSYRDPIWSNNVFFALQGHQDNDWLRDPKWREYGDVRQVMQQRQLSVSIIQAMNRVRCRRVIDSHGKSPSADIYIVLPRGKEGRAILSDIQAEMPRIKIAKWDFQLDGEKVRRLRSGSSHAALLAYMHHRLPGETPISAVRRELGLSESALRDLRVALRDRSHPLSQSLASIGVEYVVRGTGRGSKSFLVKSARD